MSLLHTPGGQSQRAKSHVWTALYTTQSFVQLVSQFSQKWPQSLRCPRTQCLIILSIETQPLSFCIRLHSLDIEVRKLWNTFLISSTDMCKRCESSYASSNFFLIFLSFIIANKVFHCNGLSTLSTLLVTDFYLDYSPNPECEHFKTLD